MPSKKVLVLKTPQATLEGIWSPRNRLFEEAKRRPHGFGSPRRGDKKILARTESKVWLRFTKFGFGKGFGCLVVQWEDFASGVAAVLCIFLCCRMLQICFIPILVLQVPLAFAPEQVGGDANQNPTKT